MRRPFAAIGFSYLAALIVASRAGFAISTAMAVLCAVCAAIAFFCFSSYRFAKQAAAVFCAAAVALSAYCLFESFQYDPAVSLGGKTAWISGTIADDPVQNYGQFYYTIDADKITVNGKVSPVHTKIRLTSQTALRAEPFDRVTATVTLALPKEQNSYGYSSRAYYKSKGVCLFAQGTNVKVTKTSAKPPYYYAILLRQYISDAINRAIGGTQGALASGILIGDTTNLPDVVKTDFSATGISHILAVSGTQTSLIMEYLMLVLCALRVRRRPAAGITAGAIVLFMAVTGFSPSVMRAGIMALVCLAAVIIRRDADIFNSLGLSAFLLCAVNPYAATDVGLLLSLTATLGMATVSKKLLESTRKKTDKLPERFKKIVRAPCGLFCETVGASLLTYPVIVLAFGRVSLISLVANMAEVPISLFVTLAAAVLAVVTPLPFLFFLVKPTALLIRLCCAFMIFFAHLLAGLPFATVSATYGFVDILVVFTAVLFVLYFLFRGRGARAGVCVSCAFLALSCGVFSYAVSAHGVMTVTVLSRSGGAVVTSNGQAVVLDLPPGDKYPQDTIVAYLKAQNIQTIDAVVLTGYDKKRAQSLSLLEAEMPVRRVYIPASAAAKTDLITEPERIAVPSALKAPYGCTVTMLPNRDKTGLVCLVSCAGSKAVVTGAGKLKSGTLGDYSAYNPAAFKANLLVFGGDLDTSLTDAVSPQFATGGAAASAQTFARLMAGGADISAQTGEYRTRGNGSYTLNYDTGN